MGSSRRKYTAEHRRDAVELACELGKPIAMHPALRAARAAGITAVVNGCLAVDTAEQDPNLPLVLDPVRTGLGVLGALGAAPARWR